jgi:hypothetical protein
MSRITKIYPPRSIQGLDFPSNGETDSDIRLVWTGANYLDRDDHTVIWRARYVQHTGYYAVTWHSQHTGSWLGTWSFGCHPFPCDGAFNASGFATNPTGGSGTVHYQEIAGLGSIDKIEGPDGAFLVTKDTWYTQARTCHSDGDDRVHRHYPDVLGSPNEYIEYTRTVSELGTYPTSPAFYIGCSDWREGQPSAGRNDECPSGVIRGIRLFDVGLAWADILTEANAIGSNAAASTAGQANTWYINDNPKVADTSDKSPANHDPVWDNARRPSDWSG